MEMKKFNFWQMWLFIVSLLLIVFGLLMAFFNQSAVMDFILNDFVNQVFWKSKIPVEVSKFQSFIYAVLGATICGWGILQVFIVRYPFKEKEYWSWKALTMGIIIWFVIDTGFSAYLNVAINVLLNSVIFLLIVIPLLFTKKYFLIKNN